MHRETPRGLKKEKFNGQIGCILHSLPDRRLATFLAESQKTISCKDMNMVELTDEQLHKIPPPLSIRMAKAHEEMLEQSSTSTSVSRSIVKSV